MGLNLTSTQADYRRQLQQLLPPGPAWTRSPTAKLTDLLGTLAIELSRLHNRALAALNEADPRATTEMLAAWERNVGVPDECDPDDPLPTDQRRLRVIQKLRSRGGQSVTYFIEVASSLGIPIRIDEFTPTRPGVGIVGGPVNGPDWWFAWRVFLPGVVITPLRAGLGSAGDPLRDFYNAMLDLIRCVFTKLKPAHTTILFAFDPIIVDHGLITAPVGETIDYGLITSPVSETVDHGTITEP